MTNVVTLAPKPPTLETYLRIARVLLPAAHMAFVQDLSKDAADEFYDDIGDALGVSDGDIAWVLEQYAEELKRSARISQILAQVISEHADKKTNRTMTDAELAQAMPRFAEIADLTLTELMLIHASKWKEFKRSRAGRQ
jgi:hypothetical protein